MKTPTFYRSRARRALQLASALILVGLGPSVPAEAPGNLSAVLKTAATGADVVAARAAYETARAEAVALGYRGDLSLSLIPSWETSWVPDDDRDPYHELSTTFEATIPTGLNAAERLRMEQALSRTAGAEAELREALLDTVVSLHSAYVAAYLRHAELAVLEHERKAVRIRINAKEARYTSGEVSLIDLLAIREELREAEQAVEDGVMEAELALLELMLQSGTEIPRRWEPGALLEALPPPASPTEDLAGLTVPELESAIARIGVTHPRIVKQAAVLDAAEAGTRVPRDPLLSSIRVTYSGEDGHSGAVSYSFRAPSVSLAYTPPAFDIGSEPESGSNRNRSDENTISFSAVFSLSLGRERTHAEDVARTRAEYEAARLDALQRAVEAEVHSRHRRISAAEAKLELARQAEERAEASHAAALARENIGAAEPGDLEAAAAALARARFARTEAEISLAGEKLRYVAAAHTPEALPETLRDTLFGGSL